MNTVTDSTRRSTATSQFSEKYNGMIKQSTYKKFRNLMFFLFSYLYSVSTHLFGLHTFFSYYRLWQLFTPVFVGPYIGLWEPGSIAEKISLFLVIPGHIVPSNYRANVYVPFILAYSIVFIIIFIFMFWSALYYKKNAKLPTFVPIFFTIFFSTLGYILHPIVSQYAGELISLLIMGKATQYNLILEIVSLILGFIVFFTYLWIFQNLISFSASFRPNSLMTLMSTSQSFLFVFTNVITLFSAIGSKLDKIPQIVFLGVTAILYVCNTYCLYMDGGFINPFEAITISTVNVSCAIMMVIYLVLKITGTYCTELITIVIFCVFIITFIITKVLLTYLHLHHLKVLDYVNESDEHFDTMTKGPIFYMNQLVTGMSNAHPCCTSWKFCRLAVERWPNNIKVWFSYAKFVAIYPEDTRQLTIISQNIIQNKMKGGFAKQTLSQISTIIRLRESNLSPELKEKLNKITKSTQNTKHKLRHVWDMIIQGNIGELEHSIERTYDAIEKSQAEYLHILGQFPNNRFVSRNYSRFLLDVQADVQGFEKYDSDTKLLQRGMNANEDNSHELGLHAFPLLPSCIKEMVSSNLTINTTEELSTIDTIEQETTVVEQVTTIAQQIKNVRFPSYKAVFILRPLALLILCFVPIVALIAYSYYMINSLTQPLLYIEEISDIRNSAIFLTAFSFRYMLYALGADPIVDHDEPLPKYLGSSLDPKEQIHYLNKVALKLLPELSNFKSYLLGEPKLDQARAILFTTNFKYMTYPVAGTALERDSTIFGMISDFTMQVTSLLDQDPFIPKTINSSVSQNLYHNIDLIRTQITQALNLIYEYTSDNHKDLKFLALVILIVLILLIAILWTVITYLTLHHIKRDKTEIYRCLSTLPKNVVSTIADRLKILKKNQQTADSSYLQTDSELNKQEENMIKIFATGGDSSIFKNQVTTCNIIASVFVVILFIGAILIIALAMIQKQSQDIVDAAPQINYFFATISYMIGVVDHLIVISTYRTLGYTIPNFNLFTIYSKITELLGFSSIFFQLVRYGDTNSGTKPFKAFLNAIASKNFESGNCSDNSIHAIYACIDPQLNYHLADVWTRSYVEGLNQARDYYELTSPFVQNLWHLTTYHLYNNFFAPLFDTVVPDIQRTVSTAMIPYTVICLVILFIMVVIEILIFAANKSSEKKLRFALGLILHCPPNIVLQSPRIMAILSNNFSNDDHDQTMRNSDYFNEIYLNLPDSIFILDEQHLVKKVNRSAARTYDVDEQFNGQICDMFDINENQELHKFITETFTEQTKTGKVLFKRKDGSAFNLFMTAAKSKTELVVTARDITQTVRYNTLISEERMKSELLLSSILPPKLVPRVTAGEKDISFAVQTTTILFLDIVEFTPWCASLQASEVMTTLNSLFTLFDNCCAKYATMTKIKCIGDCYMAAGGIFSEINQPEVHAKEVVEFGLDSIDELRNMNQEKGTSLRIRVGINTGGPIVAGVLGIGKPTFEIIGPAINMAQQMEHHGVPMNVHVSRSVYELIYGGAFEIKERGEIEIKNGTAVTYLVTKRK